MDSKPVRQGTSGSEHFIADKACQVLGLMQCLEASSGALLVLRHFCNGSINQGNALARVAGIQARPLRSCLSDAADGRNGTACVLRAAV